MIRSRNGALAHTDVTRLKGRRMIAMRIKPLASSNAAAPAAAAGQRGWRPLRPVRAGSALESWLAERGSLTQRLRGSCGRLELKVLRQLRARPLRDEVALLGLRPGQYAWVREVLLLADGAPVVYAHSVTRLPALSAAWRPLRHLGHTPVGDAVFERRGTTRGSIRVRRLAAADRLRRAAGVWLGAAAAGSPATLWARRSAFLHEGQALWVTEVFLPAHADLVPVLRPLRIALPVPPA